MSKSASCAGVVQVATSMRSAGATFARECAANRRTLGAHQEERDLLDGLGDVTTSGEDEQEQHDQAVLAQDGSHLPRVPQRQETEQDGRPIQGGIGIRLKMARATL